MSSSAVCTEEASEDREGPFGQDKNPRETQTEQKRTCPQLRYPVLPYEAEGHDHRQQEEDHHAQRRPLHLHPVSLWRDTFIAILPPPPPLQLVSTVIRIAVILPKVALKFPQPQKSRITWRQRPAGPRGPELPTERTPTCTQSRLILNCDIIICCLDTQPLSVRRSDHRQVTLWGGFLTHPGWLEPSGGTSR